MRLFLVAAIALLSLNLQAQSLSETDEKDIRERMSPYMDLTKANDFNGMMDYIYPKLFTIATREQMIQVFNGLETMGIELKVDKMTLNNVEALHQNKDKQYAIANYDIDMRMILFKEQVQNEQTVEALKMGLKGQYGTDDVKYDEETNTLSLKGNKYVIAVKDPEFDAENWYFMEVDTSNPQMAEMLLTSEVFNKALARIKK